MYYLLIVNNISSTFNLCQVDGKRICIGRSYLDIPSQCSFKDVREMDNLCFNTEDSYEAPVALARFLKREHYCFDSYPDVANLHLTHPEIFL